LMNCFNQSNNQRKLTGIGTTRVSPTPRQCEKRRGFIYYLYLC